MTPRITIGMATYDDFEGIWCTVQSVFLHNKWEKPEDVEIVIVDTSPQGSEHKKLVQDFINKGGHTLPGSRTPNLKYVTLDKVIGTTYPRDIIFEIATAPIVCVMDCHVMLPSDTLLKLLDWFEARPECKDLIHGPILYDNLHTINTQFSDQFRGGMWGTWSTTWMTPKGELFVTEGEEITDENRERKSTAVTYCDPITLTPFSRNDAGKQVTPNGHALPMLSWSGHDRELISFGYKEAGRDPNWPEFEIPGQGMGFFASRKDSWLGFAKGCSGFGGEEMNIHTKYRQAGRKAICLPFLKWNHRFGRAGGAPYPIPLAAKIRNYVLWANELGNPESKGVPLLDRIHTHFVATGTFSQSEWDKLLADPINYPINLVPVTNKDKALDSLFIETINKPRDLNEHAEALRKLASRVKSITAFVKRGEWEPFLAAGFPKTLNVYQTEVSPLTQRTHAAVEAQKVKDSRQIVTYNTHTGEVDPLQVEFIEPCDLLVIDKVMRADYVTQVLNRHGKFANKYILLRGSQAFGEKAEFDNNAPGLFYSIKEWITNNPEWFIAEHWHKQYGITLLAKDPLPRPEREVRPWPKGYGPGTELKTMLGSVGINPSPTCSCNTYMRQMDEWGIEGCEAHFDEIVKRLEEKAAEWGWTKAAGDIADKDPNAHKFTLAEKISVGWKSLTTGLAFKVDWTNPYPGLVTECIKRAKVKEES
jgi:hypothetical protein